MYTIFFLIPITMKKTSMNYLVYLNSISNLEINICLCIFVYIFLE
jgi:hypothetical protein